MKSKMWMVAIGLGVFACMGGPGANAPTLEGTDVAAASFAKANASAARGDSVRAEQYLSAALAAGYPEEVVVPELVRVCVGSNRLRTAVRYLAPYVRRHPGAVALRHVLATLYLAIGQEDVAAAELQEIVRLAPDHAVSHFLLGLYELGHDRQKGREHLRQYLALDPDGPHAAEVRHRLERESTQPAAEPARTDG
jgi:predicted Zn-dependent protease